MNVEIRSTPSAYEAYLDGKKAGELTFSQNGTEMNLEHTEVYSEFEGHGIGGALVRSAADAARANGWQIIATCPFAAQWFDRHPSEADVRIG